MAPPFTVILPSGQASFEHAIHSWDESPRLAFSIQIAKRPTLYGVWETKFAPNETDFNVEIVGFGWTSKNNTGNPSQVTRERLSCGEANTVRELITALFNDEDARKNTIPFSSKKAHFVGGIEFQDNWVIT
jgi:hypothetical protein